MLTRDQILKTGGSLKRETVDVPEWGGKVIVTELTGRERDSWEDSVLDEDEKMSRDNIRAKLIVRAVIDEDGNRIFKDDDADAVGDLSGAAISSLFSVASKLSGLLPGDIEELAGK